MENQKSAAPHTSVDHPSCTRISISGTKYTMVLPEKRSRGGKGKKVDGNIDDGWTKDQDFALQRAYYEVKPTPRFWKEVAKKVPGKSKQECYDRIFDGQVTPPKSRSKGKQMNLTPQETVPSPPVLKPVKNVAAHKKYIKQLKKRNAKREAASVKAAKTSHKNDQDGMKGCVQKTNGVQAAKRALLLDAKKAINEFEQAQVNAMGSSSDADGDDVYTSDEDESEDET